MTAVPDNSSSATDRHGVWIVVAAYNEEERLPAILRDLLAEGWENIIVVDDGSTDSTYHLMSTFPVWRLQHPVNCGKGAALKTGIEFALAHGAELIATLDADGQHRANEVDRMVAPVQSGEADVTIGSRFLGDVIGIPLHRLIVLKLAPLFTRLTSGVQLSDPHNGFRAFSAAAARQIRLTQPRFAYASEIIEEIGRLSLRVQEVPVTVSYTEDTLSKGQRTLGAFKISTDLLAARMSR